MNIKFCVQLKIIPLRIQLQKQIAPEYFVFNYEI